MLDDAAAGRATRHLHTRSGWKVWNFGHRPRCWMQWLAVVGNSRNTQAGPANCVRADIAKAPALRTARERHRR
eukprot:7367552-Alexandrium_andersonii.AAC.1